MFLLFLGSRTLVPQSLVFPLLFLEISMDCSTLCWCSMFTAVSRVLYVSRASVVPHWFLHSAVPKVPAVASTGSSVSTVLDASRGSTVP